jgi:hypothetical protein
MSLRAVSDPTEYAAAALLHPTLFGEDAQLAAAARGPLLVVSTLNDPLESVRDVMKATEVCRQAHIGKHLPCLVFPHIALSCSLIAKTPLLMQ